MHECWFVKNTQQLTTAFWFVKEYMEAKYQHGHTGATRTAKVFVKTTVLFLL